MKKLITIAICFSAFASLSAHAGLISGAHTTAGWKTVNLQGLESMPHMYPSAVNSQQVDDRNATKGCVKVYCPLVGGCCLPQ